MHGLHSFDFKNAFVNFVKMATAHSSRLSLEIEFYEAHKTEWLENHRGEFIALKGTDVLGFFASFHEAYYAAAETYGVETDVLIRRMLLKEPVFVVFGL